MVATNEAPLASSEFHWDKRECVQSYGLQTLPSTEELNVPIQESLYSKHNY